MLSITENLVPEKKKGIFSVICKYKKLLEASHLVQEGRRGHYLSVQTS